MFRCAVENPQRALHCRPDILGGVVEIERYRSSGVNNTFNADKILVECAFLRASGQLSSYADKSQLTLVMSGTTTDSKAPPADTLAGYLAAIWAARILAFSGVRTVARTV